MEHFAVDTPGVSNRDAWTQNNVPLSAAISSPSLSQTVIAVERVVSAPYRADE